MVEGKVFRKSACANAIQLNKFTRERKSERGRDNRHHSHLPYRKSSGTRFHGRRRRAQNVICDSTRGAGNKPNTLRPANFSCTHTHTPPTYHIHIESCTRVCRPPPGRFTTSLYNKNRHLRPTKISRMRMRHIVCALPFPPVPRFQPSEIIHFNIAVIAGCATICQSCVVSVPRCAVVGRTVLYIFCIYSMKGVTCSTVCTAAVYVGWCVCE